jgi:NADPH-dependent curcumin reductase CurA
MTNVTSREICLASRPNGMPTADNFALIQTELELLQEGQVLEQLNREAPDGIDVYFDNVGGETLEAALSTLRVHGRIIACGGISGYNEEKPQPGPSNLFNVTTKRLTMKGLIVSDWLDRRSEFEQEVGGYFRAGKLKNQETVVEGIDQAVNPFIGLFEGKNLGKMIVKLDTSAVS